MDPHNNLPIMHLMRCPSGLVFDNRKKICLTYSTTCNVGGDYYDYEPSANSVAPQSRSSRTSGTSGSRARGYPLPETVLETKKEVNLLDDYQDDSYYKEETIDTSGYAFGGGSNSAKDFSDEIMYDDMDTTRGTTYDNEVGQDDKYESDTDDYDITVYNGEDYGGTIYEPAAQQLHDKYKQDNMQI